MPILEAWKAKERDVSIAENRLQLKEGLRNNFNILNNNKSKPFKPLNLSFIAPIKAF
jgi:hypothetical protein